MRIDGLANFNDNKDIVITFTFPDHADRPMITADYNNSTANGNSSANANPNGNANATNNGNSTNNNGTQPKPCIDRAIYRYRPGFLNETSDDSTVTSSFDDAKQWRVWTITVPAANVTNYFFTDA